MIININLLYAQDQNDTFSFNNKEFRVGQICYIPMFVYTDYQFSKDDIVKHLRPLAIFIKQNAFLKLEIDVNYDEPATNEYVLNLSYHIMQLIRNYLNDSGINTDKIKFNYFGNTKPLVSHNLINKYIDKEIKNILYFVNCRIEVKIIDIEKN